MSHHVQLTAIALILLALGTWFYTHALGKLSRRVEDLERDRTRNVEELNRAYASHAWALYRLHGRFDRHVERPGHGPRDDDGGEPAGVGPVPPAPLPGPRGRPFAFPPTVTPPSGGEEGKTS